MRLLKSPIFHFLVLGAVLFFVYRALKPSGKESIVVTQQTVDALVQSQQELIQAELSAEDVEELIQGHIEDEILLREAYKRGVDKNDGRVRRRILQIMRSSLTEAVPDPSMAQLQVFYEENSDRYTRPESRTVRQVYYEFTRSEIPSLDDALIRTLDQTENLTTVSDFSLISNEMPKYSFSQIAGLLGKPFAEAVFTAPIGKWIGPVESFRGNHYVKVVAEHDPELPPLASVETYVRQDYQFQMMREAQEEKIGEMRKGYEVIVEDASEE